MQLELEFKFKQKKKLLKTNTQNYYQKKPSNLIISFVCEGYFLFNSYKIIFFFKKFKIKKTRKYILIRIWDVDFCCCYTVFCVLKSFFKKRTIQKEK